MPYLGIFRLEFWKTIVIFETSTRKFVKMRFLTHTVNFCIGSAFSKGPGPLFVKVRVRFVKHAASI